MRNAKVMKTAVITIYELRRKYGQEEERDDL
jgi:hypothetical protein